MSEGMLEGPALLFVDVMREQQVKHAKVSSRGGLQVLMALPAARVAGALVGGSRGDIADGLLVERLQVQSPSDTQGYIVYANVYPG